MSFYGTEVAKKVAFLLRKKKAASLPTSVIEKRNSEAQTPPLHELAFAKLKQGVSSYANARETQTILDAMGFVGTIHPSRKVLAPSAFFLRSKKATLLRKKNAESLPTSFVERWNYEAQTPE